MNRYLLNVSYIGSNFSGMQRQINKSKKSYEDNSTIQGALEIGLRSFNPRNSIKVVTSSRTDTGVHALHNTVHFDMEDRKGKPIQPNLITCKLNQSFQESNLAIRILSTELVPDTFHCRNEVVHRTYLYRFAVTKRKFDSNNRIKELRLTKFVPIEELNRCLFAINLGFDIEKARKAAELFIGTHDFRTFASTSKVFNQKHAFFCLRKIYDIKIEPSLPMTTSFHSEQTANEFDYWDIRIIGKSFVYRQIRRMVAAILAAGHGKITHRDVYEMLTIPSKHSWHCGLNVISPNGLYLAKVTYDENAKSFPETKAEKT